MAYSVTPATLTPFKMYHLSPQAYNYLIQGNTIDGHALDDNALYLVSGESANSQGICYVDGSGSSTAGTWIGTHPEITSYYEGLAIAYKIGVAGASTTTLNINNLGAKTVKRNNSNLTTHLPVNSVVMLVYDGTDWRWADYSSDNNKVTTAANTSDTCQYVTTCSGAATGTLTYHTGVYVDHSTGVLYGAAWNDYAEFRKQEQELLPGYCVMSTDHGVLNYTAKRLEPCEGIVSDTFGFAIGETDECKTPLAVAGRVLAYTEEERESFHFGDAVCASANGKVSKMTREEIKEYPDRIVGIVSEIPDYDVWGEKNIAVNNRIWIKVR